MAKAPTPSETQRLALQRMVDADGHIRRIPGGFWISGEPKIVSGAPALEYQQNCNDVWCDIRTVRAMEDRGWVERINSFPEEWRDVRRITPAGRLVLETTERCGTCDKVHDSKIFYNHNFVKREAQNASREEQHSRYLDCGPQNWDDK